MECGSRNVVSNELARCHHRIEKNPGISSFPHKDQELMKGRDMDWRIPCTKLILG